MQNFQYDSLSACLAKSFFKLSRRRKDLKSVKSAHLLNVLALVGVTLFYSSAAIAKDYIVEVILFENLNAGNVTESHSYKAPEKPRTEAQAWLLEPELLMDAAQKFQQSPDYVIRQHFAWGQEALPYRQSATYTVLDTDTRGYIKVYADNLLFANIDLDYKGFRMQEKRRLKLNEKHFFDHPKFGLLMQVSRLEPNVPIE